MTSFTWQPSGGVSDTLALFVHSDDRPARRVYEKAGFRPHPRTSVDHQTGAVYESMVLFHLNQ